MTPRLRLLMPAVAVAALACASTTQSGQTARRSSNLITTEELRNVTEQNAYDAIRRLRPQWLRSRSGGRSAQPVLIIQNVRAGDLEQLRTIAVQDVLQMRYISASDATTRWGTGFTGGAIEVTMRGRGR